MRRSRSTTLPLGRELLREAVDALRIRSRLPPDVQRTATRYFDEARLIKPSSRAKVHGAIAEVLARDLGLSEGAEHATRLLTDAIDDLVGWWDATATAVNALSCGAGPRRLALLPGTRLLVLDLGLRLGGLLRLLEVGEDLLNLAALAGRGRLFWHVLETERGARGLPVKALRPPLGPTRNGLKAWSKGTLPRAQNLEDLALLLVPSDGQAPQRRLLLSRLRLAVALDTLHAYLSRTVDGDFAAGALRYGVDVCRLALQQPRPVEDDRRWRELQWELVRRGGRAAGARFPLEVVAVLAGPLEGMEAVELRRGPSALLSWWAVLLAGSEATRSGMDRARVGARRRPKQDAFEQVSLRMLRMYPLGYRGPPALPVAARASGAELWARFWALELLGAHASQLQAARRLMEVRPGPMASLLLARALRLLGDSAAAESRCWSLHETRPSWSAPLVELGECALARHDYHEAARLLDGARARAPEDDQVAFLLAVASLGAGDLARAEALLRGVLRRIPSHGPAAGALAFCCSRQPGRSREARGWAKLAARLGTPEGLQALSATPVVPVASAGARKRPEHERAAPDGPPRFGAFSFVLTPVEDGLARRWRPIWQRGR